MHEPAETLRLTDEAEAYARDGYLAIPDLIGPTGLAELEADLVKRGEIPVELRAGSVLFFNGYLLHRSRPNPSSRYRRALVNHYMNTQSPLHWCLDEKLADGSSHGSDNRSVHIVCGEDPYAHLGYTTPANPVYLRRYWQGPRLHPAHRDPAATP